MDINEEELLYDDEDGHTGVGCDDIESGGGEEGNFRNFSLLWLMG